MAFDAEDEEDYDLNICTLSVCVCLMSVQNDSDSKGHNGAIVLPKRQQETILHRLLETHTQTSSSVTSFVQW